MSASSASPPYRANSSDISSLGTFSSCETVGVVWISDALLKLKVPHGGYIPDLEVFSQGEGVDGRVVGEAYTVKMVDSKEVDAPKLAGHFIDQAPQGCVMVISSPPGAKCASLGGLLGTAASVRGVQGVVIDGRCRDLSELRAIKLPVFARGHSTLGTSPFTRASAVQVPLTIAPIVSGGGAATLAAVTVNPFDLILADIDGVVVVEPRLVAEVLEIARKARAVDEKCMEDLKRGRGVKETFGEHRGK